MIVKHLMPHIARALPLFLLATTSYAGSWTLRIGPAASGAGGTNPVGIPPGIQDLDIDYLTSSKWETSVSIFPGILVGKRLEFGGPYVSLGGGLVVSQNGIGPGPYSAFGWDIGSGSWRFNMEYKQAIGFTSSGVTGPYAVRIGVAWY